MSRSRNLTRPVDLLVLGVVSLILAVVASNAADAFDSAHGLLRGLAAVFFIAAALLVLGAGLAKVIAIGVRSGRD